MWRTGVRARARRAKPTFFGTRNVVCQITGENGTKFKIFDKNRICGRTGMRAGTGGVRNQLGTLRGCAKPTFFGTRHVVCQITGENGTEFKIFVKNRFCRCTDVRVRTGGARNQLFLALGM